MIVLLTLTIAGSDTGPFDLYSDLDSYITPFETGVSKIDLEAGYTTEAPDYATIIRITSTGDCINSTDITLSDVDCVLDGYVEQITTTTTTTTTIIVPCSGTSSSGGYQVDDQYVNLDSAGGVIVFLMNARAAVDKMEFYHGLPEDGGTNKVATTSQTLSDAYGGNYGPFDNVWGTPPLNTLPNNTSLSVVQFIGTNKGTVPTRQTQYYNDTGFTISNMTIGGITYEQVIWWKYTNADYLTNSLVTIRVTGGSTSTQWESIRLCPVIH